MRKRSIAALMTAALAAGALVSAPLSAPAAAAEYEVTVEQHIIETRHGHIYAEVARPTDDGKMVKGPAILTLSPYSALGRDRDGGRAKYVPQGYVRVFADVIGTGNSGGCYDYGGKREKQSGADVVEWIAKQDFSNGKVAMMGGSYDGATAIAAATQAPKGLVTIVPEAAVSSWYDYNYSGGIRHSFNNERPQDEGIDTPLAFDFGFALPPPLDPQNPEWAARVASSVTPCDELEHTQRGYDDTPDFDGFWRQRDYVRDANKINVPVLIAHNWGDWNVRTDHAYNLFRALNKRSASPKVSMFMGHRYLGHTRPGGDYEKVKDAWLDHYLMGKSNSTPSLPAVTSQQSDYDGPRGWYRGGIPRTKNVTLFPQETVRTSLTDYQWKLLPSKPQPFFFGSPGEAAFPSVGINAEAHANFHGQMNHEWWWFESPMLDRDVRIFGEVKIQLWSKIHRKWVTLTPTIVDVDMSCHERVAGQHQVDPACLPRSIYSTTRGMLDTRYRKGLGKVVESEVNKPFKATVVTEPQDYVFKKHHVIALNVSTELIDWMVPKHYPGCDSAGPQTTLDVESQTACTHYRMLWEEGQSRVILPVVGAPKDPMDLFDIGGEHNH